MPRGERRWEENRTVVKRKRRASDDYSAVEDEGRWACAREGKCCWPSRSRGPEAEKKGQKKKKCSDEQMKVSS